MRISDRRARIKGYRLVVWGVLGVMAVALLAVAFLGQEQLFPVTTRPNQEIPAVLAGAELKGALPRNAVAQEIDGGLRLFANTRWGYEYTLPAGGPLPLYIIARGLPLRHAYPCLTVQLDYRLVAAVNIAADQWGLFRVMLPTHAGRNMIGLGFINDAFEFPEDCNLDLRELHLGALPPDAAAYYRWRAPADVAPERMAQLMHAYPGTNGVEINENGFIADIVHFEEAGPMTVYIKANAIRGAPLMVVSLDGHKVAQFRLHAKARSAMVCPLDVPAGLAEIRLAHGGGALYSRGSRFVVRGLYIGQR